MSDTSPSTPEAAKPKLSLTPKAPATYATPAAPTEFVPEAAAPIAPKPSPGLQNESSARPPALVSSGLKPSFKLQGAVHAANPDKFDAPVFASPKPAEVDGPFGAFVAVSAIAAAAAITFAVLLFLKYQS